MRLGGTGLGGTRLGGTGLGGTGLGGTRLGGTGLGRTGFGGLLERQWRGDMGCLPCEILNRDSIIGPIDISELTVTCTDKLIFPVLLKKSPQTPIIVDLIKYIYIYL